MSTYPTGWPGQYTKWPKYHKRAGGPRRGDKPPPIQANPTGEMPWGCWSMSAVLSSAGYY